MVSFGTVEKRKYTLIETGEYVFTLQDVGEISGDYGDRMQWDFLVAEKGTPTEYIARDDGNQRVLRFWTDPEITLGSKQHEWIQALAGRSFGEGDTPPDGDDLLSKRMLAYLTHYSPKKGKNAGVPREDIVQGSAKPFRLGGSKPPGAAKTAAKPAPLADDDADERAELIAAINKQIRRAVLADIEDEVIERWKDINLAELTLSELRDSLQSVKDAIEAVDHGVPF